MTKLLNIIISSFYKIIYLMIFSLIFFISFTLMANFYYGENIENFSTGYKSIVYIFGMCFGYFNF